jgi:putative endonuclease
VGNPQHELGRRAEEATGTWLVARGWRVLERRWRCRLGELDLVALDPSDMLVGLEVKVRSTSRAGTGPQGIDRRRLRRLRGALAQYAAVGPPHRGLRLDVVSLEPADAGTWRITRLAAADAW